MMEWAQILSFLFTNALRLLLGLCLAAKLAGFSLERKALLLAGAGGCLVTSLQAISLPFSGVMAAEALVIAAIAWHERREKWNLLLFLAIFYEIGVGLWDFLLQAGLGILFRSKTFVDPQAPEHLAGIWLVRLAMLAIAALLAKQGDKAPAAMRLASVAGVLGLFGAVTLSEQTILPLSEDQTGTWILLSMALLFSILFYRLSRQREMEREIARLKQEQAEILERDYQALSRTYESNAKLYHDLHNHMEALYQCLTQGDIGEAIRYCEDLRAPVQGISQMVWTGDKAMDALISSKMALAEQAQIKTKANIEYPHNTNIRGADLVAILGNLLDNALEAAQAAPAALRFFNLTIRRIHHMLIIKVENGYGHPPVEENGNLRTSKADKSLHGWGLKSVQAVAERYDGTVTVDSQAGVFQAVVTLSFQPVKAE